MRKVGSPARPHPSTNWHPLKRRVIRLKSNATTARNSDTKAMSAERRRGTQNKRKRRKRRRGAHHKHLERL
jgi:hypothetical protein